MLLFFDEQFDNVEYWQISPQIHHEVEMEEMEEEKMLLLFEEQFDNVEL